MDRIALALIAVILSQTIAISLASNDPELASSDHIMWAPVYDDNKYGDWATYTRHIVGLDPIIVFIKNIQDRNFTFAWKIDKINKYRDFSFYINDSKVASCKNSNWTQEGPYAIGSSSLMLKLWITDRDVGQVWIAFPSNKVIIVDPRSSIQKAIDTVADGGSIIIKNGTYYENLLINKPILLTGETRNEATIDLNGKSIDIAASNVTIANLTIRNGDEAIRVFNSSYINILNNLIADSYSGIMTSDVKNMLIRYNTINTKNSSIILQKSTNCEIKSNKFLNNKKDAIRLKESYNNTLENNRFIYSESCDIFEVNFIENSNKYDKSCRICPDQDNHGCKCCS